MSELIPSPMVEQSLERVLLLINDEMITVSQNLQDDLQGIRDSLAALVDVLHDAEEQKVMRDPVRLWLRELKEVGYQTEHILDELSYEILRRKVRSSFGGFRFLKEVVFSSHLVQKFKNLNQLFKEFQNEAIDFGLQGISSYTTLPCLDLNSLSNFEDQVVGMENDVSRILSLLCATKNQPILTVIPIVGTEGIGKATLAKLVCQKAMENILFDVAIWVSASELSDSREIFEKMLQSLNGTTRGLKEKDVILEQLEGELMRKTFILVLNDVQDVGIWWDDFKTCLSTVSTKTRNAVVVTTCSKEEASIVENSYQHWHELGLLSNDEFNFILKGRAYWNMNVKPPLNVQYVTERLTYIRQNVPLFAKVVGGTLGFSDATYKIPLRDSGSVLKLCFDSLPSYLKSCFVFCLIFPKDFPIQKVEIIQLWMAEGLVESFDKGKLCFNALINSSFLQDMEKDDHGVVETCKIHGLVHRLAFPLCNSDTLTRQDYLYAKTSMQGIPNRMAKKLRTLILDNVAFQESWIYESLRAIVFLNCKDMEKLPSSIGRLKHLRLLDVSNTAIRALPKFVTELYNLQTLKFLKCKELNKLPKKNFNQMMSLKCIAFSFEHQMPFGLGLLKGLELLSFFVVGSDKGGSIQELEFLNELRGHLDITRLENVRDKNEAKRANLQQKTKINGLSFQWSYGANDRSLSDEELLECLQPHPNIQNIKIKYYIGKRWPSWIFDSFVVNNLVSLTLEHCWNCVQLPQLGDLPCLKLLTIQHMERVKYMYDELYKGIDGEDDLNGCLTLFPALKSLSLSWMGSLTEWTSTERLLDYKKVVVFPRLETLYIQSCAKLASFPMKDLSALVKINIIDCDELRFLFHEQPSFPSLTRLSIIGCPKLVDLKDWLLSSTSFTEFIVRRCKWLESIPLNLGMQSSLKSLEISCCKGLAFFSEEILCQLSRLRKLSIGVLSEKLDDFRYLNRIKDLPWLEELEIWGSDFSDREMSHLPDQLQHLTNLESLKITGFTTMEALPEWLSDLQSLRCLSLNYCWHLEYQSTATIVHKFSNLKHLYMYRCHTLEENKSQWNEWLHMTKIRIHFAEFADDSFIH